MNTSFIFALIFVFTIISTNAEEPPKDNRETYSILTVMDDIDGTVLMRSDVITRPEESKNITRTCTIGYMTAKKDNKEDEFIPVMSLPSLKNDEYIIKVIDGELKVTTKNTGNKVVTLNLRNLVPTLLAQ